MKLVQEIDPYDHLRGIHNWTFGPIYPNRDWMTHVCHQNPNTYSLMCARRNARCVPKTTENALWQPSFVGWNLWTGRLVLDHN